MYPFRRIREKLNVSGSEDIVVADDANYYDAVEQKRTCTMKKQVGSYKTVQTSFMISKYCTSNT